MSEYKLCRLCFTENEKHIEIFSDKGKKLKISSILAKHFWFEVNEHDGFSQNICINCWTDTDNFHEFYCKIENIQKKINFEKTSSQINANNSKGIKLEPMLEPIVSLETLDLDKLDYKVHPIAKVEILEDRTLEEIRLDSFENADDDLSIKTGGTDSSDFENVDDDIAIDKDSTDKKKSSDESSDDSSLKYKAKRGRKKKAKIYKYKKIIKTEDNSNTEETNEAKGAKKIQQDDEQILKFVGMNCELCDEKFVKFSKMLIHYTKIHGTNGYVTCCTTKFFRKERILEHIDLHIKPNEFRCHICDRMFPRKYALKRHIGNHEPYENRKYKCDQCSSSFNEAAILKKHIRLYHEEITKDFLCTKCQKNFTSKSNLAQHIRQVHEKVYAQVCDICAKTFTTRHALINHQLEHSEGIRPKLQCNLCGSWLKNAQCLRRHIKRHTDEVKICKICNKPSQNADSLSSHMSSVHGERTHKCTVCDKAFKKAVVLKEHMTFHTGQQQHKCLYCPKTFRINSAKYIHTKRHHYEQFLQNRVSRNILLKKPDKIEEDKTE